MRLRFRPLLAFIPLMLAAGCEAVTQPDERPAPPATPQAPRFATVTYPTGMVAPVDSIRDYNGTYEGGQGIGRGYSTLYRDTYTAPNGWRGEGSGMHQGVDIRVNRMLARAARAGLVVRADSSDRNGWGGIVIIRATNPYPEGGYVYFSYAHLSEIHVANGSTVTTGQIIGRTGGNSTDSGKGAAQGAHLHFQVDKTMSSTNPWPYTNTYTRINTEVDNDFEVMNATHSPMVFVQGGYRWEYQSTAADLWKRAELWQAGNVASWGVSGGALWMDGNFDPSVKRGDSRIYCAQNAPCTTQIAAVAAHYRYVELDLHLNCAVTPLTVYFMTNNDTGFSQAKSVDVPVGYGPATLRIDMRQNPNWSGIITGLRIDPSVDCGWGTEVNYIGYIRLTQ